MTDWPKMESMVTISDAYFASENFKDLGEITRQGFLSLSGVPLKVISLCVFLEKHLVGVTTGTVDYSVPLEFVEPVESETENKKVESMKDWFIKASQGNPPTGENNTSEVSSFIFTNDIFLNDAILFFFRNGYKVWVEEGQYNMLNGGERLNVEMPKERM